MTALEARVQNRRLVRDEPTKLPEGTEVYLTFADGDDLDDESRAALHQSIQRGLADVEAGRVADAETVIGRLQARSGR